MRTSRRSSSSIATSHERRVAALPNPDWNWTIAPGAETLARSLVGREPEWFPVASPEKQNTVRALFRREGLFCKFFKKRRDQAESEWKALTHLASRGVAVPRPVAWSPAPGGGAVLATVEIPGAVPLKEAWRRALVPAVAQILRDMHAAGFLHLDLHTGNILVSGGRLTVIDCHRGRIGAVSAKDEERALGQFCYSLSRIAPKSEVLRLVAAYFPAALAGRTTKLRGSDPDLERTARVFRHADAFRRRHLASRTRRCLKESTGFAVSRGADGLVIARRPAGPGEALEAIAHHDKLCAAGLASKVLEGRRISTFEGIVVKEWKTGGPFRALRNWVKGTPARAAWIAAQGLRVRGLPAPEAIGLVEQRGRSAFISREAAGKPLDRYCREDVPQLHNRRALLDSLAALVARLHCADAHHRDLKANNILADGPTRFSFLDLEDVEFRRIRRPDAVKALAQLNAALPVLTKADRWRMLKRYAAGWKGLGDLRAAAAEIMKATVARKHNWPGKAGADGRG
ncbi:MAG: lipopolysaccharide kinase InaA family protein [Planctomycetes bacterium]|nr:lipopolysaccharide kinase InaA family protein [Planctomycetota bacterium]